MNLNSSPTVSVIMPAYNSEAYVGEAIESILNQTYEDFEFIIVDDGSTDSTPDIVRRYAGMDKRIRPFFIVHCGAAQAANICISKSRAQWVARLDADDVALPHRLKTQLAWIRSKDLDICGSQAGLIGKVTGEYWFPEEHEAVKREFLFRYGILQSSVMLRTTVLRGSLYRVGIYSEDYELWTRLITGYKMGNIPEVLFHLRSHDRQSHILHKDQIRREFQKYRFRYFYELYPHTPLQDYLALAKVSDKQPITSISELRRAGRWLADLADHPDPRLRQKMAGRWQDSCKRSKALGDECEAVFQEYVPMIQPH